jgi:membrane protease YdiL (CAAX protease family)
VKQRRRAPAFGDLLLRRDGAHPATLDVSTGPIEKGPDQDHLQGRHPVTSGGRMAHPAGADAAATAGVTMPPDRGSQECQVEGSSGPAGLHGLVCDRQLMAFMGLAVGFSWAWWVPVALAGGGASHFPGLLGPFLAAVLVTAVTGGRPGLRHLRGHLGAPRWWALALLPLVAAGIAVTISRAVGDGPSLASLSDMPGVPAWSWPGVFLAVLLVGGAGEETGWRGLAWPRLRQRYDLRDAALLVTLPWGLWHLPLFWIDSGLANMPPYLVPGWLVALASGAVVLGWLYERSGSLLVVALAHTAVNLASGTRGGEGLVAAAVSVAVIAAALIVLRADRRDERAPERRRVRGSRAGPGQGARPARCAAQRSRAE